MFKHGSGQAAIEQACRCLSGARHHKVLRGNFERHANEWRLPWAILPEVDYLVSSRLGADVGREFLHDLADGAWAVEWGEAVDLVRASEIARRYKALKLGLVDCIVMAITERLEADAIATLDVRHFSAVAIRGEPRLLPRDLEA